MAKPPPPSNPLLLSPESYAHSPIHLTVLLHDLPTLSRLISTLPRLSPPSQIQTEADSINQELISDQISQTLDRRDVPLRETPLHLAVKLNDVTSAKKLAEAGADVSLQNDAGWNALQEALCRRNEEMVKVLVRSHHRSAWEKWRRRLPRLVSALKRMRDFYMEIDFHFESSVIPFVGKIAPSDTYKIWKRDGNLRADTSLAGFDGLKIQRADQSFLFFGEGESDLNLPRGNLLVLNRDEGRVVDAFEKGGMEMSDADVAGFIGQSSVYRPGMDVTKAQLVCRTNWRRQEKVEGVGEWRARVYEVHNVVFSFRSRKVLDGNHADVAGGCDEVTPLELDEDEEGFLVADNPEVLGRRHSSFVKGEEKEWYTGGRKSVDFVPCKSLTGNGRRRFDNGNEGLGLRIPQQPVAAVVKEKEYVKSLKPWVWLTEQFPLRTEELLPLLDILASKVKAVRRMRELLTTKLPPGTFPVKVWK